MSSPVDRRALELLEEVLELEPPRREAFLDALVGDDAELRPRVEVLLLKESKLGGFLDRPDSGAAAFPSLPQEGEQIGGYRLLRGIGSGGMGAVYEAEQASPRRTVALKLMRPEIMSEAARKRFRVETEILAHLSHPGIAQIHEVGMVTLGSGAMQREIPFFAMEYISEAQQVDDYVQVRGLTLRERLELFQGICRAVHHGHQKGVIHRDLKPSNILVDADGRSRVIDFGVARVADASLQLTAVETQPGQIVGTLTYMSPEQLVEGPSAADIRADVYSLGVVLYQMLCGRMPYDVVGKPVHEVARIIREQPVHRPITLRRDLQAILYRTLEKDRERRYASVAALDDDLGRFLREETVEARPPSLSYQLRMFTRRHRIVVTSMATVLMVVIGAMVISLLQRNQAIKLQGAEAVARERADSLLGKLLDRNLELVYDYAFRIQNLAGATDLSRDMLSQAVKDLQQIEPEVDDPALRLRIAEAHVRLGDVRGNPAYGNVGDREGAVVCYEAAAGAAGDSLDRMPGDPAAMEVLGKAEGRLGSMMRHLGRLDESEQYCRKAIERFTSLSSFFPDEDEFRFRLALEHERLAKVFTLRKELDVSLEELLTARDLLEEILAHRPSHLETLEALSTVTKNLASIPYEQQDHEGALGYWEQAIEQYESLSPRTGGDAQFRLRLAECWMWKGTNELLLERLDQAEESLLVGVDSLEEFADADLSNSQAATLLPNAYFCLGNVHKTRALQMGEIPGAIESWEEARSWFELSLETQPAGDPSRPSTQAGKERIQRYLDLCDRKLSSFRSEP
jgi:serine/threonine protein kinase